MDFVRFFFFLKSAGKSLLTILQFYFFKMSATCGRLVQVRVQWFNSQVRKS